MIRASRFDNPSFPHATSESQGAIVGVRANKPVVVVSVVVKEVSLAEGLCPCALPKIDRMMLPRVLLRRVAAASPTLVRNAMAMSTRAAAATAGE